MKVKVRLFVMLLDYVDHGMLQARILGEVAFPLLRRSSQQGIKPRSLTLQAEWVGRRQ